MLGVERKGDRRQFIAQIQLGFPARYLTPESRESRIHGAFRNGETRTRTGDTTIFRRSLETLEPGENTRKQGGCSGSLVGADTRRSNSFHGDSGDDCGLIAFLGKCPSVFVVARVRLGRTNRRSPGFAATQIEPR
jgi:hypothetical protein